MTTANKITILRILLIPFFIAQVLYYLENGRELFRWLAVLCFGAAVLSDAIDGYIARRFNQRSQLGAVLDPLADKLLLVSSVILLSGDVEPHLHRIPLWLTATIIGRDILCTMGLAAIYCTCEKATVRPVFVGKMATVFQMVVVIWILLKWDAGWLRLWLAGAGICTLISGAIYVVAGIRQLSASPSSGPDPDQGK